MNRKVIFNIPNLLTYGRIAIIPFLVALIAYQGPENSFEMNRILAYSSAFLFILAGVSDIIDGHYARKYGMVSLMGKFFDPLADKLIHMAVMVMLIPLNRIYPWLVVLLLFREILITGVRAVAAGEGMIMGADKLGKQKMIWLTCGLSGLLFHYDLMGLGLKDVGWFCMWVGTVLSLISAAQYLKQFFQLLMNKK